MVIISRWAGNNDGFFVSSSPAEYVSQPISFEESDFKRRSTSESRQNEPDGVDVPFQSDIIDFNGSNIISEFVEQWICHLKFAYFVLYVCLTEPQAHQKIYLPDDVEFRTTASRTPPIQFKNVPSQWSKNKLCAYFSFSIYIYSYIWIDIYILYTIQYKQNSFIHENSVLNGLILLIYKIRFCHKKRWVNKHTR